MFYNPTISNYNLIFLKFQGGPFESHEEKVMKLEIIVLHIKRTVDWNSFYSFLDPQMAHSATSGPRNSHAPVMQWWIKLFKGSQNSTFHFK